MRAALQFLTVLPVPAPHVPPGAAAVWFPLAGALIGLAVAAAWHTPLHATTAMLAAVILTGGLHEDGLADVSDAVRAHRSRERMLEILKDSHIGAYGAVAIVLSILVRWHAMSLLSGEVWWKIVCAFTASRAAMVVLAAWAPPVGAGLGQAFRTSLPRHAVPLVIAQAAAVPLAISGAQGWYALGGVAVTIVVLRAWFLRRLGGVTGDCLGFQCQAAEAAALVVLAWR